MGNSECADMVECVLVCNKMLSTSLEDVVETWVGTIDMGPLEIQIPREGAAVSNGTLES
jgi:hypothetical protein